ncbi:hydroxymethylglutaryl-CoA reductase, degradative [Teredinibacter turnerae]|uniref:hydroxymethylglutaryl-CoA reductase, degradative n=1 Tax=Teredinibacter turnerae TaxID=2426 RepID=UPI00039A42FA|nr:hydroxymethylglutaryl-CoA reductase, degradative [Teredinibacter turnerae]
MSNRKTLHRKFRKLSVQERLQALFDAGYFDRETHQFWQDGGTVLQESAADRMIENVVGRFAFPQGIAVNFPLNGQVYQVPLVLEEPSVVAALSFAALLAEKNGGFTAAASSPILIGQVQLTGLDDPLAAEQMLRAAQESIARAAQQAMPNMVARGGGLRDISFHHHDGEHSGRAMLVVHLHIDTQDAMGANMVNSVCEAVAPLLEAVCGGEAVLKILSNLADEALAQAEVTLPCSLLAAPGWSGEQVRDRIILASDLALADPYRATTHNKGIMNGVDALALATGNDWRSIEAAAHAFAARSGQYRALSRWTKTENGDLQGELTMPIKVGTVGGSLQTNPAVLANLKLLGISRAQELASLMAAVGLAQNFAALRALASNGIQQGHMTLHARSVALAANAPSDIFDDVVKQLVASGDIKIETAQQIIQQLQTGS